MKFIFFSGFLWIVAIFHLWDHRRFECDVASFMDGARDGDWRVIAENGAVVVKRAFKITTRADIVRYAGPVVFLFVWLLVFRYWTPAVIYMLAVFTKWFLAQTYIDATARRYTVSLFGRNLFTAKID